MNHIKISGSTLLHKRRTDEDRQSWWMTICISYLKVLSWSNIWQSETGNTEIKIHSYIRIWVTIEGQAIGISWVGPFPDLLGLKFPNIIQGRAPCLSSSRGNPITLNRRGGKFVGDLSKTLSIYYWI